LKGRAFLKNLGTDGKITWSIISIEVVLWKCVDNWILEKETVYENCDHVAMWIKNHVERSTIMGMMKESERDRLLYLFP
jgi:hypothetical protein